MTKTHWAVFLTAVGLASPVMAQVGIVDVGISTLVAMSADGQFAVGDGFRWSAATGPQFLGLLPGATFTTASSVSGDGSVVTGHCYSTTSQITSAFRWDTSSGIQSIGSLPGYGFCQGLDISADSLTIVGVSGNSRGGHSFRWSASGGMLPLGNLPGGSTSWAYAVSADGTYIAGDGSSSSGVRAYRWSAATGMQDLGVPAGFISSDGYAISGNGMVVVGTGKSSPATYAGVRWTQQNGMQSLGTLDGYAATTMLGLNYDGSLAVGRSTLTLGGYDHHAVLWSQATGLVDLNTYLPTVGVNLAGWILKQASGISAQGDRICGWGWHNNETRGWVVQLPPLVAMCYANCDHSTSPPILNANDFQCFLNAFAVGNSLANCDNSTSPPTLNANDFQCFLNRFAAGCL